jgi:hypothetical protein
MRKNWIPLTLPYLTKAYAEAGDDIKAVLTPVKTLSAA